MTRSRVGTLALAALVAGTVSSCEESVTGVNAEDAAVTLAITPEAAVAFEAALADARERVLASYGDAGSALTPSLRAVSSAVIARDRAALERAVERLDADLARMAALNGGDAAAIAQELDVVRLIVTHARHAAAVRSDDPKCNRFTLDAENCS